MIYEENLTRENCYHYKFNKMFNLVKSSEESGDVCIKFFNGEFCDIQIIYRTRDVRERDRLTANKNICLEVERLEEIEEELKGE